MKSLLVGKRSFYFSGYYGCSLTDVVTEFIEGLVETYPGLQFLDGFPEVIIFF